MSAARPSGNASKDAHEKNMEHLVKCVGILFGIRDNENNTPTGRNGSSADIGKQTLRLGQLGGRQGGDSAEANDENQPKLPYKKGSITEIFHGLGFNVLAEDCDNKRLVEAIFAPKSGNPKGDDRASFRFKQQTVNSTDKDQSSSKTSLTVPAPASSRCVRKNFAPPRLIEKRFSPPRNICDDTPAVATTSFAEFAPPITDRTDSAGSSRDNHATIALDSFCKKVSANPTGPFHNNLPTFNLRNEARAVAPEANNSSVGSDSSGSMNSFKSAYEKMIIDDKARGIKRRLPPPGTSSNVHVSGLRRTEKPDSNSNCEPAKKVCKTDTDEVSNSPEVEELMLDERLKNVDSKMVEAILNEIIEIEANTQWDDIAGLDGPKAVIREIIIWPVLRPDLFKGLRDPPKGVLLFGPPGTGKTMIGRLIATQSKSTFFNISASSLTSKWIGDGEKMVRALFQVARIKQPSVIFIDEIDSILTQRSDTEHESSRRLKTEFLIHFDGCGTASDDRILVIGVTNRPQELDEAARRRLVKRIYIPLPDVVSRKHLVKRVLMGQNAELSEEDFETIAQMTDGYSGADMSSLVREAAYGPIRDIGHNIETIDVDNVRPIQLKDFEAALKRVKASVASQDMSLYERWDEQFGCHV